MAPDTDTDTDTDTSAGSARHSSPSSSSSSSSAVAGSSTCGGSASTSAKPHKAHDRAWRAIRGLQARDGSLGLGHFALLSQVGCGDIGSVHVAQLRGSECVVAMKVMDKQALSQRSKLQRMHNEREILERLDHPFLPTLYTHFDTEQLSCLVMEFCSGGDLHSLRQRQRCRRFGVKAARFYAAEVLVALEYLHVMGVIYRDLKPENVLVRDDGHIVLTDFDLSLMCEANATVLNYRAPESSFRRRTSRTSLPPLHTTNTSTASKGISCLPRSFSTRNSKLIDANPPPQRGNAPQLVAVPAIARSMSFVGTHEYLAPEIIAGNAHGSAVDWWTFGIFLYEMLFGRTPFRGESNDETLVNIMRQPLGFPDGAGSMGCGSGVKSLIRGLLVKDPASRLGSMHGAAEIKRQPFFRGVNWALIRCAEPPDVPICRPVVTTLSKHEVPSHGGEESQEMWTTNGLVLEHEGSPVDFDYF